jgi:Cu(I)/Ag(I) efflux system membrane fusion protein
MTVTGTINTIDPEAGMVITRVLDIRHAGMTMDFYRSGAFAGNLPIGQDDAAVTRNDDFTLTLVGVADDQQVGQ